jgi:hypothetical protein
MTEQRRTIDEAAQNGHGIGRAPQRAAGFCFAWEARSRALCALDEVEEAVSLLQRQNAQSWVLYLTGTAPLILSVLALARDMGAAYGNSNLCLRDSFVCALAFLWASFWKARFANALVSSVHASGALKNGGWECAFIQCVLQSGKLLILPFAILSVVPMPSVSIFFRAIHIEANRPGATLKSTVRRAGSIAAANTGTNWIALLIATVAFVVVFLNVFTLIILLPRLLHSLSGTESEWTRANSQFAFKTLFSVAIACTWLVLDPFLQAFAAVRWFYAAARRDGRDLQARLRKVAAAIFCLVWLCRPAIIIAVPSDSGILTAQEIGTTVQQLTQDKEYAWLQQNTTHQNGVSFAEPFLTALGRAGESVSNAWQRFIRWLNRREDQAASDTEQNNGPNLLKERWLLYAAAALVVAAGGILFIRRRTHKQVPIIAGTSPTPQPAAVEDALATERPEEEWLALADELAAKGELRLAIRALYLASLACLGRQGMLGIAKHKSNAMYERELALRCRKPDVCMAFASANRDYERVWYGMHQATQQLRDAVRDNVWRAQVTA